MNIFTTLASYLITVILISSCVKEKEPSQEAPVNHQQPSKVKITEINADKLPTATKTIAITDIQLIDGLNDQVLPNTTVLVTDGIITSIGTKGNVSVPPDAEVMQGKGLTLLPGLIDAHFHLNNDQLPNLVLQGGVTSLRDPGAWIESYENVRKSPQAAPRLFLTGPHLDQAPPAYPKNSYIIRDAVEARYAVNKFADQGASAFKVYFRLPPEIIKEVCTEADRRGLPVVAHLEITRAKDAILAGVDGIEHVTSFGSDLLPVYEAEQYIQSVIADNSARREGRYQVWDAIDIHGALVDSMLTFLTENPVVVSPTLGAFEYRFGDEKTDTLKVRAFENMLLFVGKVHDAGIPVVVGSHSWVPYQKAVGWAFQREMELLAESGLTNMEVIKAATIENAKFFKVQDRLGTVERGKQADLLLIEGNPLEDLSAIYQVRRVMLNGTWVE